MFFYWLLGGSLLGLVSQHFFKLWNTLDEFVNRSSDVLRQRLYEKLGIKG
jgi:hypothetical protein